MHTTKRYQNRPVPSRRPRSDPDEIDKQGEGAILPVGNTITQDTLGRYKALADTINAAEKEREDLRHELIRQIERGDEQETGDLIAELKTSKRTDLTQDNVRQVLGADVLDNLLAYIPPRLIKNLKVRRT